MLSLISSGSARAHVRHTDGDAYFFSIASTDTRSKLRAYRAFNNILIESYVSKSHLCNRISLHIHVHCREYECINYLPNDIANDGRNHFREMVAMKKCEEKME